MPVDPIDVAVPFVTASPGVRPVTAWGRGGRSPSRHASTPPTPEAGVASLPSAGDADLVTFTSESLVLSRAQQVVGATAETLARIAELNGEIAGRNAHGDWATALREERAQLVGQLANVTTAEEHSGVKVQVGAVVLVAGTRTVAISVKLDPRGGLRVLATHPSGSVQDITSYGLVDVAPAATR